MVRNDREQRPVSRNLGSFGGPVLTQDEGKLVARGGAAAKLGEVVGVMDKRCSSCSWIPTDLVCTAAHSSSSHIGIGQE